MGGSTEDNTYTRVGQTDNVKGTYEWGHDVVRIQCSLVAHYISLLWVVMTISTLVIAWFLILFVPNQEYPVLKGPYLALQECQAVKEWYEKQGRITGGCSMMTVPQETMVPLPEDEGAPYMEVQPRKQRL